MQIHIPAEILEPVVEAPKEKPRLLPGELRFRYNAVATNCGQIILGKFGSYGEFLSEDAVNKYKCGPFAAPSLEDSPFSWELSEEVIAQFRRETAGISLLEATLKEDIRAGREMDGWLGPHRVARHLLLQLGFKKAFEYTGQYGDTMGVYLYATKPLPSPAVPVKKEG